MSVRAAATERIGRYRILGEIGRGAMGVVYEGVDDLLERPVAIKTILVTPDLDDGVVHEARFLQEAKAAGGLNHPNVITVYDVGRENDLLYMAMELLDGEELRDLLARGRPPLELAVDIAAQIADGLAVAHERGVVHRDIKPSNIMIVRGGRVKIMDFGIARVRTSEVKTQTGVRLGSPRYMAPEQIVGTGTDARTDLFALGVVLYEMLAGAPPFGGEGMQAITYQVAHVDPPAPSRLNPAVPTILDLLVAKTLAKDPARRYQSAAELAADLRASLQLRGRVAANAAAPAPRALETGAETGPLFRVSRRFDSSAAVRALAAATGVDDPFGEAERTAKLDAATGGA
jgi:serine/threonine-protein kinase